jgi:hypothetical protein
MTRILLTPLAQRLLQLAVIIDNSENPGVVRTMIHRFNEVLAEIYKSRLSSSKNPEYIVFKTDQYERVRKLIGAFWLRDQLARPPLTAETSGVKGVLDYFKKLVYDELDTTPATGEAETLFHDLESTRYTEPF